MGEGQRLSRNPIWRHTAMALGNIAYDGLAALADIHMLHRDRPLAARPGLQAQRFRRKAMRTTINHIPSYYFGSCNARSSAMRINR